MIRLASVGVAVSVFMGTASCAPRPVACSPTSACVVGTACVANLCQSDASLAALASTRRFVLDATEIAFIQQGSPLGPGELPSAVTLGRRRDAAAALLLRFDVPSDVVVVEAYLLLDVREDGPAGARGPSVHAERIVGPWEARTATWVDGPALRDVRAPSLRLGPSLSGPLRLDVRALFARPDGAEPPDQGIAIVADVLTERGGEIALIPGLSTPLAGEAAAHARAARLPPRLELYVK